MESCAPHDDRSHALRGNAARDAPRPSQAKRGASVEAFPRGAWERSNREQRELAQGSDWIEQFVIRRAIAAANHSIDDRSHALRGNAARDAPRPSQAERGASVEAFPRGAWERSNREQRELAQGSDWIEQFVIRRAIAAANHSIAPSGLGFIQRLIRIVKP